MCVGSAEGPVSDEFRHTNSVYRTTGSLYCVSESEPTTHPGGSYSLCPSLTVFTNMLRESYSVFEEHLLCDPDTNTGTPTTEISGPHILQVYWTTDRERSWALAQWQF